MPLSWLNISSKLLGYRILRPACTGGSGCCAESRQSEGFQVSQQIQRNLWLMPLAQTCVSDEDEILLNSHLLEMTVKAEPVSSRSAMQ